MFKRIKTEKKILLVLLSIFFLFNLSGCQLRNQALPFFSKNKVKNKINDLRENILPIINIERSSLIPRMIDGLLVENKHEKNLPVAIVFDNFPGVPKPTLVNASIIYEMPVEGGLTRFLVIFDLESLPQVAGPIRSARSYLAEVAGEYQAPYIHAGGSPDALLKLKQGFYKVINLDEISGQGKYFYRQQGESAPHNLYIKKESIVKFLEDNKILSEANFSGWYYDQEIRSSNQLADKIEIIFSPIVKSVWQYDSKDKDYLYLPNGKSYYDKDGQQIKVKNLIIQYAPIKIIDEIGRREINLNGQGEALIFQVGKVIQGKWIKEASRTKFYNQIGEEIIFLPGKTWVSVIAPTNQVTY